MFRKVGQRTAVGADAAEAQVETRRTSRREERRAERRRTYQSLVGAVDLVKTPPNSERSESRPRPHAPQSSFARPLPVANATSASQHAVQLRVDVPLLLSVITLLIFGLVMVYSASYDYSLSWYGDASRIFIRQLTWMVLGISAMLFLTFFDYHYWRTLAVWVMGATLLLLFGVLINNEVLNGASRTLYQGSVQPSELAKLVTVIYLAVWLYSKRDQLSDVSFGLIPLAGILGLLGGLIMIQPDLSAAVTILLLGGLMFFLAGGDLKQISILAVIALLVGWGVVAISTTGSTRIQYYLAGLKDPTQGSYHVQRAFEAFVRGGWFGAGLGKAQTKLTGLPVPPTDSIFAVVGEETGVVGACALVGLYMVFLWRGMTVARRSPDQFGALMAAGLTLWICFEAFVNMAVMVNLAPFAGNALPFISAGGSNLVASLAAVGILLNISRMSVKSREESGRQLNAWATPFDLRGRDRRRRVSSVDRSASANE